MPDVSYGQSLTGDEKESEWKNTYYTYINVSKAQHAFECLINDSTFYYDD